MRRIWPLENALTEFARKTARRKNGLVQDKDENSGFQVS
jgi:hypothetical protein